MIIFILLISNTGCWSRRELEELAFVLALGIDKGDDGEFILYAQIGKAQQEAGGGDGEGGEIVVIEGKGKTIVQAYDQMFEVANRRLFLSHARLVIISEELAKSGINRILDFLQRDIRIRSTTLIAVGQGDIKEILESQPVLGGITGLAIKDSMRFNWERSKILRKELYEMVRDIKEGDAELTLPIITMEGEKVAIKNAAYFQNTTMKGTLDNKEVLGLLWLVGDVRHGSITINPNPKDSRYITLELMDTKVSINPVEGSKGLVFHIKVDQQLRVADDQTNLTVSQIEQEVNRYIKNTILETVNLAKEEGVDFIGFGKRYRRKYPKKWDEDKWIEKFKESEVIIKVNSIINREER